MLHFVEVRALVNITRFVYNLIRLCRCVREVMRSCLEGCSSGHSRHRVRGVGFFQSGGETVLGS